MEWNAAVITVSDKGSQGLREDTSGPALCKLLEENGYQVVYVAIVPDELEKIQAELLHCADELRVSLILTTGGTGFSKRDVTPEATEGVLERRTPGIPEAMRAESMRITPMGCLSRETAGIRGDSLIINLPGSKKASTENFSAVLPAVWHGLETLYGISEDCARIHRHEHSHSGEGHHHG
ncbi:MAG: MogA/MoaB family molybdenum cofactor biosynthesis protein [Oscillospiraceae bacterium]|nr:MogA/MoaB family molybdenum cofactor biosynthesis protein [Oscillospiraceae bacterium]